ncbi:cytochrome oxidase assembly [Leptothrix cholodnii SP-6]|uniref:Cytochrome oxidase assembly n=1 Tax=Leptothrix cholodnii (strain ATCC 51168 / LMG 8142 / SP-6) TaxID=395495 RepID=B1Y6Q3_LEPCP|nr:COX15/CtaA family protein [Leptothrix cholodnii]ACB36081.1 cytochrome oxidase assembly [Leptothrix cholodnii SP-6]
MNSELIDLSPLAWLVLVGLLVAAGPLAWLVRRQRGASTPQRLRALTLLTLFLTFDLVLFGAYTRLSDSGLGCPDWPGCYGSATPLGAHSEISQAQAALPSGPVTHGKAWVEMVHRYLASGVGMLLTVLMVWSWRAARREGRGAGGIAPAWATLSFVWVCLQGAFGALTVTMKLYPAIVTAHLLGGIGLLALLAVQAQRYAVGAPGAASGTGPASNVATPLLPAPLALPPALRRGVLAVLLLVIAQVTLGGWVSTNYAVLACTDFPTCHGSWWPTMDFASGFTWQRELGRDASGNFLPFAALTAIHYTHRLAAFIVLGAMATLAWRLWRSDAPGAPVYARWIALLAGWQLASGLSNVVLGWPLLAALAHTGGAAVLVSVLAALLASGPRPVPASQPTAPSRARPNDISLSRP